MEQASRGPSGGRARASYRGAPDACIQRGDPSLQSAKNKKCRQRKKISTDHCYKLRVFRIVDREAGGG